MRSAADFVYDALCAEMGWDRPAADALDVVDRWATLLLKRQDVPLAWRRQPHLLPTMLRRAGHSLPEAAMRSAQRWRLARLPVPVREATNPSAVSLVLSPIHAEPTACVDA